MVSFPFNRKINRALSKWPLKLVNSEWNRSVVLLDLCEHMKQVLNRFTFLPHLEHHGRKQVTTWLSHVELNAANHTDLDVRDLFDDSVDVVACD